MRNISDLKYERSWLEIDLDAIRRNISAVRRRIDAAEQMESPESEIAAEQPESPESEIETVQMESPEIKSEGLEDMCTAKEKISPTRVKVMAIIKADAYGHGAVPVAKALESSVDFFGVATIDEAEELREAGITLPILILGYTSPADYTRLIAQDIRPSIYQLEDARKLSELACSLRDSRINAGESKADSDISQVNVGNSEKSNDNSQKKARIHIALDTGMTRIGFAPDSDSVDAICEIASMEGIEIEGLFTHFSCADMTDKAYTERQMAVYDEFAASLSERGIHIPLCHIENSAGIMEFTHHRYQMVRSGIVTYGLLPSDEVNVSALDLQPAMAWKSRVVDVKTVGAGLGVSYGATYVTKGGERIATISTGYGDGYPRSLSGKGYVLIHSRRAPILGRVCMDQFMVDVSDIPDVRVEDIVTLMGTDGGESITAEQIGSLSGRFNYELVCDMNKRVPRYYRWTER